MVVGVILIILVAQLEVDHDNRNFSTSDGENYEDNRHEAEHIVELVQPQAAEDEEHLNEGCSKWNDPSKNDSHWRAQVPRHRKGRTEKRMGIMDITKGVLGVYC